METNCFYLPLSVRYFNTTHFQKFSIRIFFPITRKWNLIYKKLQKETKLRTMDEAHFRMLLSLTLFPGSLIHLRCSSFSRTTSPDLDIIINHWYSTQQKSRGFIYFHISKVKEIWVNFKARCFLIFTNENTICACAKFGIIEYQTSAFIQQLKLRCYFIHKAIGTPETLGSLPDKEFMCEKQSEFFIVKYIPPFNINTNNIKFVVIHFNN